MPTVSVVMPAYNAEKYIAQAFDSLIAQTFSDWQCVVVNDGSTDGTLSIIESYAARDPRFIYASIPNSGSAKIPRDTAIEMATSEWIVTLDADDYFAPDVLEKLIARQSQTSADIVYLRMQTFDNATDEFLHTIPRLDFNFDITITGKEALMMTIGGWQIGANGSLVKRSLHANRAHFNNSLFCHMNADEYDTRELLSMARTVAFTDTSYHYRINSASITRNISPKLFDTVITDRMVAELVGREFGVESAQYRKAKSTAIDSVLGKYFMWARYAKHFSIENRQKVDDLIRGERARYSCGEIWHSDLNIIKKILLISPRRLTMLPIKLFTAIKK